MESASTDKPKRKPKIKITETEISSKIEESLVKIENYTNRLRDLEDDLDVINNRKFQIAVTNLKCQYLALSNYSITLATKERLRKTQSETYIRLDTISVVVKFLKQFLTSVMESDLENPIETNLYTMCSKLMTILLNYTDTSHDFGVAFCQNDTVMDLYLEFQKKVTPLCMESKLDKTAETLLKSSVSTLYNTLLHENPDNLLKIREMNYFENIKKLLYSKNQRLKISALLFTAYVIDEKDSKMFRTDNRSISYLIELLEESMKLVTGRKSGLSTLELAKGISRLSKNDENKQLLVELGILPVLKKLLNKENIKLKESGLSILWSLAFDDQNNTIISETMKDEIESVENFLQLMSLDKLPEKHLIMPAVEHDDSTLTAKCERETNDKEIELITLNDEEPDDEAQEDQGAVKIQLLKDKSKCKKVLDGLQWTLGLSKKKETVDKDIKKSEIKEEQEQEQEQEQVSTKHIMISYSWANKELVMKVYNFLTSKGYKLWIDKYNMVEEENIMQSMAIAIENAEAVIVCVSQPYRDSENCRAEAVYARTKHKPLIPIIVQEKYRPDGWLGFCIAGLLYVNFTSRYKFEDSLSNLYNKVEQCVKVVENKEPEIKPEHNKVEKTVINTTNKWTAEEIIEKLKEAGLENFSWNAKYTGSELLFLKQLRNEAPEHFYFLCMKQLEIDNLRDLRIFVAFLTNLQ